MGDNDIQSLILPVSTEEFEKAGVSKFPVPGLHLSQITERLGWKTKGKSIVFKFVILTPGEDKDKVGEMTAGIESNSVWKFKESMKALGIKEQTAKMKDGSLRPKFDPGEPLGKQFYSEWVPATYSEVDPVSGETRTKKYVKCEKFWSVAEGAKMTGGGLPADEPAAVEAEDQPF